MVLRKKSPLERGFSFGELVKGDFVEKFGSVDENLLKLIVVAETFGVGFDTLQEIAVVLAQGRSFPVAKHLDNVDEVHVANTLSEMLGMVAIVGVMMFESVVEGFAGIVVFGTTVGEIF